jgi:hypothetical protein
MNDKKPKRVREPVKFVLVSPETHAELKAYAKNWGYNMQGVADEAIQKFLKRKEPK